MSFEQLSQPIQQGHQQQEIKQTHVTSTQNNLLMIIAFLQFLAKQKGPVWPFCHCLVPG
jgi:hypothetical protein